MEVSMNVTALYLSLTTFLAIFLAVRVVKYRRRLKVGRGDGGSAECETAIRAHANLIENAPLFFLLLAVNEVQGAASWCLHLAGLLFCAARLAHAYGFTRNCGGYSKLRVVGTATTWLLMTLLALALLVSLF